MEEIKIKKEIILNLVAKLLDTASSQFCNHGCNDLSDDFWDGVSKEESKNYTKIIMSGMEIQKIIIQNR